MLDIVEEVKCRGSDLGKLPQRGADWDLLLLDQQPAVLALLGRVHGGVELRCIILLIDDLPEVEIAEAVAAAVALGVGRRRVLEQIEQDVADLFLYLMRVLLQVELQLLLHCRRKHLLLLPDLLRFGVLLGDVLDLDVVGSRVQRWLLTALPVHYKKCGVNEWKTVSKRSRVEMEDGVALDPVSLALALAELLLHRG